MAGRGGLIKVGAEVVVDPSWWAAGNGKQGPLKPGVEGVVLKDDLSCDRPWLVEVSPPYWAALRLERGQS